MIHSVAILLVFIFLVAGVVVVPMGLPGTWVIALCGVVYSLFYRFDGGASSALKVNGLLIAFAIVGELADFVISTLGNKPLNVSTGAIWASLLGGLVGAIVGVPVFLIGSVLGLFIGAFLGALFFEWATLKNFRSALASATAVLATRAVASGLKTCLAFGMALYLGFKLF